MRRRHSSHPPETSQAEPPKRLARLWLVTLLVSALGCGATTGNGAGAHLPAAVTTQNARADTAFALDVLRRVSAGQTNVCLSPFNLRLTLLMAHGGARGDTAREMAAVLRAADQPPLDRPAVAALRRLRQASAADGQVLALANRLWGMHGVAFHDDFLALQRDAYGAPLERIDFGDAAAVGVINGWIAEQTGGLIRDLLKPGSLSPSTPLVLTGAVYFKALWAEPFSMQQTVATPFFASGGRRPMVHMMSNTVSGARYAELDGVQVLELPYRGGETSMVIALPRAPDGLAALEARMTPALVEQWQQALRAQEVSVMLPRFRLDSRFSLADALQAMGMATAFDPARADFSGMSVDRMFIAQVVHGAFVEVDESGTEAAAATAVVAGYGMPPPIPTVHATHPFLFFIRHPPTGAILFMGRITDPCADDPTVCPNQT